MRALALGEHGPVFRADWPEPRPAAGETLVRVLRAGICETDLQLVQGYKGFRGVLGHEFVGIALSGPLAGRRVVGEINCGCGACETCLAGSPGHCLSRRVVGILDHDGAFADVVAIPQRNLHAVPDAIPTDAAVFVEPVAAAFEIPAQLRLNRDDRIVVLGDGRLGNLCAQVLSETSDRVLVIGKHRGEARYSRRARDLDLPARRSAATIGGRTSLSTARDRRLASPPPSSSSALAGRLS